MTGESITFNGRTWVPVERLDEAERERDLAYVACGEQAGRAARAATRLVLAERLAEAVEAYVRVADGHVPGEPVEDLLMESMRRFDAIQPALSAFRESEKKG